MNKIFTVINEKYGESQLLAQRQILRFVRCCIVTPQLCDLSQMHHHMTQAPPRGRFLCDGSMNDGSAYRICIG